MDDFEKIYRKYFQYVYFYILQICQNKEIAEEVTQETFFKAMSAKSRFEHKSDVRTWLCRIAKNEYLMLLRKGKKIDSEAELTEIKDSQGNFVEQLADKDLAKSIHKFIHELGEPYKEVFNLRVFAELPFKEIGDLFGKSDAWARVTFARAKLKIIERMEQDEDRM